jgi:2-C-methyl-D-erythritol 4-phosphate cytidylyltransferase/2-C-methyl-D-erythritol 2,4-cyclodiphosphate synthase
LRESHRPRADAVVVAAGSSSRMGGIDKLMASLAGRPLLAWSTEAIAAADDVARIVVVAAPDRLSEVRQAAWLPDKVVEVVPGGDRRQDSVGAGVTALERALRGSGGDDGAPDDRVVLVHDGARPLVTAALVGAVIDAAATYGAAIPVLPVAETIKRIDGETISETVDRIDLAVAQTPQGIRWDVLRRAIEQRPFSGPESWTDEAALLEACKIPVHAVPGEGSNIKVTLPADLRLAEARLSASGQVWIGQGHDSHPFGAGYPLLLGGVAFDDAPRLSGHSDGDVVLHAVADALLGGARMGDLGRLFPPDDRTPRGIASSDLLAEVLARLRAAGLRPQSVDVTIVAARPRLGGRLDDIRARVAELTGVAERDVSIKASTGNLIGAEGEGRAMSAVAVAQVVST